MTAYRSLTPYVLICTLIICSCTDIKTVNPIRKNIVTTVYASGEIVPEKEHWISSEKSGRLLKKCVKEGDTVKAGQVLYIIEDETRDDKIDAATAAFKLSSANISDESPVLSDIKLEMIAADAKYANDSANFVRWENLWQHGIGTKSNLDNAYTQYIISLNEKKIAKQRYLSKVGELKVSNKIAQSDLTNTQKDVGDGVIVSDQAGIVYETLKDAGESVALNEKLLLIGNCSDRIIKLSVDQQDIGRIKAGQEVLVQADQSPDEVFKAHITFIYPSMNRNDQTFCIEAKFDRHPPYSFVHTPVEANIVIDRKQDVLVVPKEVLVGKDSVWIKENKRHRKVFVKTGVASFDYIEVTSGISEKNAVILDWYKLN